MLTLRIGRSAAGRYRAAPDRGGGPVKPANGEEAAQS